MFIGALSAARTSGFRGGERQMEYTVKKFFQLTLSNNFDSDGEFRGYVLWGVERIWVKEFKPDDVIDTSEDFWEGSEELIEYLLKVKYIE